jgi:hypothetical protein
MSDSVGSIVWRAASAACLTLICTAPCAAQLAPPPLADAPTSGQFMSRYDFHLAADALATDDQRFEWDTHFGGDFDFIDYVHGRTTFLADYRAVLGSEFRPFDPNQSIYTLEAATSARMRAAEVFFVLHHVSRHLGDRPNRVAVAWNVLQARVLKRLTAGATVVDVRADAGKVVAHATVDYSWTADADVLLRRPLSPHADVFVRGYVETLGINSTLSGRSRQTGGRLEGGIRLPGAGGALELVAGYERIVDADAFEQAALGWTFAGFRLVTR